jgi:TolB-like protein
MLGLLVSQSALADSSNAEKPRILVMDFAASKGIEKNLVKTIENIFGSYLVGLRKFEVIQKKDLVTLLEVDLEKQMVGCSEESCLAEIGGALGARWIISGTVALLGGRRVLTLKLVDAQAVRLQKQLTKTLPADEGEYAEAIRVATYELYDLEVPVIDIPWYPDPLTLGIIGTVLLAGGGAVYFMTRPPETIQEVQMQNPPDSSLGTVVFGISSSALGLSW